MGKMIRYDRLVCHQRVNGECLMTFTADGIPQLMEELGERLQKEIVANALGDETKYVYDIKAERDDKKNGVMLATFVVWGGKK